jgi:large subunit ribosomal protein L24
MLKIKVGDQVVVTAGKDKGKKTKVMAVDPRRGEVVLEGANIYVRHQRKSQGRAGEIVRRARPLSLAKVAIINDQGQPDRVGFRFDENGKKIRIYKKTKTPIKENKV